MRQLRSPARSWLRPSRDGRFRISDPGEMRDHDGVQLERPLGLILNQPGRALPRPIRHPSTRRPRTNRRCRRTGERVPSPPWPSVLSPFWNLPPCRPAGSSRERPGGAKARDQGLGRWKPACSKAKAVRARRTRLAPHAGSPWFLDCPVQVRGMDCGSALPVGSATETKADESVGGVQDCPTPPWRPVFRSDARFSRYR